MASSGPYQSHLFNFLNRQVQKVADKAGLALRHLKVAAVWGTQILIYPVYAVYQTARIAGRQLKQTVRRTTIGLQQSQPEPQKAIDLLATDAPIHLIIGTVEQLIAPDPVQETKALSGNVFGWLRSLLPTRKPKLLITQNTPSSILRAEVGELEAQLDPRSQQTSLLPHEVGHAVQSAPALPIQGVASMIASRHMVVVLVGNVIYDILTLEQQYRIEQQITIELASLAHRRRDHQLNEVPAAMPLPVPADRPTLFPIVRVFQQLMAWVQRSPVAIATNLFGESTFIESASADWFTPDLTPANLPGNRPFQLPSTGDLKKAAGQLPRWTDIEALVWAAIHYFFGNRGKQLNSGQPMIAGHPTASDNAGQFAPAAPWLTLQDVFKPSQTPPAFYAASSEVAALPTLPELQIGRSLQNWMQRLLKPRSPIVVKRPTVQPPTDLVPSTPSEVVTAQTSSIPALEFEVSDWIETEATAVGYIQSPWQRFLAWLDAGVQGLEQTLIRLWNWLTGR